MYKQTKRTRHRRTVKQMSILVLASVACLINISFKPENCVEAATGQESTQPISSRLAFLRAQRAAAASRQAQQLGTPRNETAKVSSTTSSTTTSTSTPAPVVASGAPATLVQDQVKPAVNQQQVAANNRSTRTADVFQSGEGFNIFVTNTCERELMHVNIKTSRPFYGVIHTRNQRQKALCTVEGTGDTEYNLDISHVLTQSDPSYCGVIRARKESPEDKDLLSVVLAVRVHRNIELSDDKFFLLNCTNRCRRADCASAAPAQLNNGAREDLTTNARVIDDELAEREGSPAGRERETANRKADDYECNIWKFPGWIALFWCMAVLLLASLISHCIMCSSLVCRCVRTEVEEREPSVYEGATDLDDEDSLYKRKTHPMRIDYDNRDIYQTTNNYQPYTLGDEECDSDNEQAKRAQTRRSKAASKPNKAFR